MFTLIFAKVMVWRMFVQWLRNKRHRALIINISNQLLDIMFKDYMKIKEPYSCNVQHHFMNCCTVRFSPFRFYLANSTKLIPPHHVNLTSSCFVSFRHQKAPLSHSLSVMLSAMKHSNQRPALVVLRLTYSIDVTYKLMNVTLYQPNE